MSRASLLLGLLLVAPAAFGQTSPNDSQTLQALLSEVRQLRQQLQTLNAASQRTQILFFRIQTQQTLVERASQRAEDARAMLADTQSARKKSEAQAKDVQDSLERTDNAAQKREFEGMAAYYKGRIGELADQEQQRLTKQSEAEEQLRLEQAKLDELDAQLDELDKALQKTPPRLN